MKKSLFLLTFSALSLMTLAQSPRMVLYEEFTGENCGPCAATNPLLNQKLHADSAIVIPIKWQVPIPSAPSATWSLYKTNQAEIDWRWKSTGYGYNPPITSAPSSKIDGKEPSTFGASSSHPANLTHTVLTNAQAYTSPFTINITRAWNKSCTAVNVTITVQASAAFTSVGNLVFRTVMVERLVQFPTPPGSNGETTFEDVVIKSFPTLQLGTPLPSSWTVGQTQTFTMSCPLPAYTRKKDQVAIVGFIQDDGDKTVKQAARANKQPVPQDAVSSPGSQVYLTCTNMITPTVQITNESTSSPITNLTLTPYIDGTAGAPFSWTGNLAAGATMAVPLNQMVTPTLNGNHTFSCDIDMSISPYNLIKNNSKLNYMVATNFQTNSIVEGFVGGTFPPSGFAAVNPDAGPGWSRANFTGGYNLSLNSAKYDFFNNPAVGDQDELYLPPVDLSTTQMPYLTFDMAYAMRNTNSDDALDVLVSTDCGANWTNVYNAHGYSMIKTTNFYTAAYVPASQNPGDHWRTEQIDLSAYTVPGVVIKFVTTNDHGNNLFLDNINLALSSITGLNSQPASGFRVSLFPNPSSGITQVQISTLKAGKGTVSISNALGQIVYSKALSLSSGANQVQVDLSSYAAGIYMVSVETEQGTTVKKLNLSK